MAFSAILAGLAALLKLAPQLFEVAKLLGAAYQRGERFVIVKIQLDKFDEAAKDAEQNKDPRKLEDIFRKPPTGNSPPAP